MNEVNKQVTVLFFAALREQLGTNLVETTLDGISTLGQLRDRLCADQAQWKDFLMQPNLLMAVNQLYAKPDTPIFGGDEIAFFPPVTGG